MLRRKELPDGEEEEEEEEDEGEVKGSGSPPREEYQRALLAAACNGEPPSGVLSFAASTPTVGHGRSSAKLCILTVYRLLHPLSSLSLPLSLSVIHPQAHSSITLTIPVWVVPAFLPVSLLALRSRRSEECPNLRIRYWMLRPLLTTTVSGHCLCVCMSACLSDCV